MENAMYVINIIAIIICLVDLFFMNRRQQKLISELQDDCIQYVDIITNRENAIKKMSRIIDIAENTKEPYVETLKKIKKELSKYQI